MKSEYLGQIEVNNGYNGAKSIAHIVKCEGVILEVYSHGFLTCKRDFLLENNLYLLKGTIVGSFESAVKYIKSISGFPLSKCEKIAALEGVGINAKLAS